MGKLLKVGVWFLAPILATAWVAVLSGAISVMGTLRGTGHLVNAASITTLSSAFAVLVLAIGAAVMDATGARRLATATRVGAFVVTAVALVAAAVLMHIVLSA
ncbi:MAG: hypothetical protein BGO45_06015 [Microbacterium sp. 71-36]|uniref:hypothetical protein n=1 Tax=unclassified Microbacterium TaxID=2609290 RepID=UPI000869D674|nr:MULTISPECIES: hypothetical protein [unclassified Microbacterium]MBN9211135.1 hypothetical protein [Microbacterium sp.]ODT38967.1 MAG: hypothetical protein ABS60_08495 [Microbacterium sp. SCN 71-17]OJV75239.1 MAG: hypothetical protein BGO45_06015 [Microbacterium sp. 71-36]